MRRSALCLTQSGDFQPPTSILCLDQWWWGEETLKLLVLTGVSVSSGNWQLAIGGVCWFEKLFVKGAINGIGCLYYFLRSDNQWNQMLAFCKSRFSSRPPDGMINSADVAPGGFKVFPFRTVLLYWLFDACETQEQCLVYSVHRGTMYTRGNRCDETWITIFNNKFKIASFGLASPLMEVHTNYGVPKQYWRPNLTTANNVPMPTSVAFLARPHLIEIQWLPPIHTVSPLFLCFLFFNSSRIMF